MPGSYPYERPDVCAGYVAGMPQVIEAVRAATWRKEGALSDFFDGDELTPLTKWAIDMAAGSMREVEQHNIRTASEGSK